MRPGHIGCLCCLLLVAGLIGGCASKPADSASTNPPTQKKGHWITLPPETGSMISRRVWVTDTGEANQSGSGSNVQTGSAADVQRMQDKSRTFKPAGP